MKAADPVVRTGRSGASAGAECSSRPEAPGLTVFYDGSCPLCRREIEVYRGLEARAPVCFADVSDPALAAEDVAGRPREALLARFHVRAADGRLLDGAAAFLALWAALPGWRWLARAGRLPGAPWLLERLYRLFLRGRPWLQRWARRLDGQRLDGIRLDGIRLDDARREPPALQSPASPASPVSPAFPEKP